MLLAVSPDSGALNARPREVLFRFDEVVSERPQGAADLRALFLLSPRDGDVVVRWRRDAIGVRPRRGWRPNTVYSVTMLPGLVDLRGNVDKLGARVAFSTGADFPATRVTGIVFDWSAGRPAPRSTIEAIDIRDSTTYVAVTDSTGQFDLAALRPGQYAIIAAIDANNNRRRDAREAWDSVLVDLRDNVSVELLAIAHDTIGPRLGQIQVRDSLTLRLTVDQPIALAESVTTANVRITRSDSTPVAIAYVATAAEHERRQTELQRARADSVRLADTTRRVTPVDSAPPPRADSVAVVEVPADTGRPQPKPSRQAPPTELLVRLERPLTPATVYRVRLENLRGLISKPRTSERVFSTPRPAPPKDSTTGARPDTTRARPDTVRARPDTTRPARDTSRT